MKLENFFNLKKCTLCGICLSKCPVFNFPLKKAKNEMTILIGGKRKSEVLSRCTSCFSCNLYCPYNCNPHGLILYRWFEEYKEGERKISSYLNSIVKGEAEKNIYLEMEKFLSFREKEAIRKWQKNFNTEKSGDLLFLGCNQHINPSITFSSLLSSFIPFSLKNMCCGEPYYRAGNLEKVYENAQKLEKKFKKFKNRKIVFFCPACYNMFANILPEKFGIKFNFEKLTLLEWLWQKIKTNKIGIRYPLNKTATIQDSCHSKEIGEDFQNLSRNILNEIGVEVIEMEHTKKDALCCGLGAYLGNFSAVNVVSSAFRCLKEAKKTAAEILCTYCNGCFINFSLANLFTFFKIPIFHIIELLNYAVEGRYLSSVDILRKFQILKTVVKISM